MTSAHSAVDWGNVPAWFGAVLTGGSLLLGFSIITRDRRKAVMDQARKLAWSVLPGLAEHQPTDQSLSFFNASEAPLYSVSLEVYRLTTRMARWRVYRLRPRLRDQYQQSFFRELREVGPPYRLITHIDFGTLLPKATAACEIQPLVAAIMLDVLVTFRDANGRTWQLNAIDGRLRSKPERNGRALWFLEQVGLLILFFTVGWLALLAEMFGEWRVRAGNRRWRRKHPPH